MAFPESSPNYDYAGYVNDNEYDGTISVEPVPRQFLPRIITGSEIRSRNPKDHSTISAAADPPPDSNDGLIGSRFKLKSAAAAAQLATISQNVGPEHPDAGDGRDTWDNPIEFFLSCISMSVGLGTVWRFPGVAAANGGGAFLIPYIIVLLVMGRPLLYLEMCLGQFSRYGQVKVWNMAPLLEGVGYGSSIGAFFSCSYYVSLMAIAIYYFILSFSENLSWSECHQERHPNISCDQVKRISEAQLYYKYTIGSGLGKLHWPLVLCLIGSWILIFITLWRGVKSSGKVAYFTAIFSYIVLFILLILGVTLKGGWDGIKMFLEPKWGEIAKPKVWYSAVEQCFFSLSVGFGPVIMFSSYNGFKQNIYKDALIISFMNTFTSLLSGITLFAVSGNIMHVNNVTSEQISGLSCGPGLPVIYSQAIAFFVWAQQPFAVLFFLMLFTSGIGSATSLAGCVITIICDQFPRWKRWAVTLAVCVVGCAVGLMYVGEERSAMLSLIDHYDSGFFIYIMIIFETAGICYIYGLTNICNDIEFMLGRTTGIYWRFCWAIVLPFGLLANLLYYLITEPEFTIRKVCGWLLTSFAVGLLPNYGLLAIFSSKAPTFKEKFLLSMKPTRRWGPQNPKLRQEWLAFKAKRKAEYKGWREHFGWGDPKWLPQPQIPMKLSQFLQNSPKVSLENVSQNVKKLWLAGLVAIILSVSIFIRYFK